MVFPPTSVDLSLEPRDPLLGHIRVDCIDDYRLMIGPLGRPFFEPRQFKSCPGICLHLLDWRTTRNMWKMFSAEDTV